jgi:hypothetical protein
MVKDCGIPDIQDIPSRLPGLIAEVGVFSKNEELDIKKPYILECLASHHQAGA